MSTWDKLEERVYFIDAFFFAGLLSRIIATKRVCSGQVDDARGVV